MVCDEAWVVLERLNESDLRTLSVRSGRTKAGKHHDACTSNTSGYSTGGAQGETFIREREQVQTDKRDHV